MLQAICAFYLLIRFLDKSILKIYHMSGLLWVLRIEC